jgi:hypothetical protein
MVVEVDMGYTNPHTVRSPKDRVKDVEVIFDKGPQDGSWSLAKLKFDGSDAVGIRWNGEVAKPGVGTPSSRSNPTWFIVPTEIAETLVETAKSLSKDEHKTLLEGYRAMAADTEREAEAMEWSEALLGDLSEAR